MRAFKHAFPVNTLPLLPLCYCTVIPLSPHLAEGASKACMRTRGPAAWLGYRSLLWLH